MTISSEYRTKTTTDATNRPARQFKLPTDNKGQLMKVSDYFGENVFDFRTAEGIPESVREELISVARTTGRKLKREHVEVVAKAATEWATQEELLTFVTGSNH